METDTIRLLEFTQVIFHRPTQFVRTGSFEEVANFLEGYTEGVLQYAPENVRRDSLSAFGYWLSDTQLGLEEVPHWPSWFVKIGALYPEDAEALQEAIRLYEEFITDPKRAIQPNKTTSMDEAAL